MKKRPVTSLLRKVLFGKILENLEKPAVVLHSDAKMLYANPAFRVFFYLTRKRVSGEDWIKNVFPEDARPGVRKIFSELKRTRNIIRFDSPVLVADTIEKCITWTGLPVFDGRRYLYLFIAGRCSRRIDGPVVTSSRGSRCPVYREIINDLFNAARAAEPGTALHSERVMTYALKLARKIRLPKARVDRLRIACLLHDIGKLGIDEDILLKKGRLNLKEYREITRHPDIGTGVVGSLLFLDDIIPVMAAHHENYDGSGYPLGTRGEEIPLEARILAVADIYEALTARRTYRSSFTRNKALKIMEREKGKKLDPSLTDIFIRMIRNREVL